MIEYKSFRICIVQGASHVAEKGTMRVTGGNLSSTYLATQSSTTSALKCTFPHGSSYSSDMYFAAQIYLNDWRKYDYLDFYLYLYVDALESITCMMGDAMVPLAVQYIDSVDSGNASISVVARVDLTGLARSSSSTPILTIRALVDNSFTAANNAGSDLTVLYIGNNLYRVYGSCPNYSIAGVRISITVSQDTVVSFKSLRVCTVWGSSHVAEKGM